MYSIFSKKELAHEESIWCCAWRSYDPSQEPTPEGDAEQENGGENKENEENRNKEPREVLITGGLDDIVRVWSQNDGEMRLKHNLTDHSLGVVSVDITKDATKAVSSAMDSTIHLWDLASGQRIRKIGEVGEKKIGPMECWTTSFSPDGKHIITGAQNGKIHFFNTDTGEKEQQMDTRGKFILSIAYSPDGKYIASGATDGIINVFDVTTAKLLHTLEGHAMQIRSLAFSPDSERLLSGSDDGQMRIHDVKSTTLVSTLSGHKSWVLSVAFAPDNQHLASGSADHSVKVWDGSSKQCVHTFNDHTDQVWGVAYNIDGSKLMSVSEDKSIHLYSIPV